jgi:chemotaxis protein MotB
MRTVGLLATVVVASLMTTGCEKRGGASADRTSQAYQAENARLTEELERANQQVQQLSEANKGLQQDLALEREQAQGLSQQLRTVSNIKIDGLKVSETGDSIVLEQDFGFNTGSHKLNKSGHQAIEQLAKQLNEASYADTIITVEGHTDDTPVVRTKDRYGDNWGLSAMRAAAVVSALQAAGIDPARIKGGFRGPFSPRVEGSDKKARAANRRVEIMLSI